MGTRASGPGSRTGGLDDKARADAARAVTGLYQTHAVGLIRLAVVMLGDRAAAEDVVQEAFCGLYRRWGELADPGKALSYARTATLNGCRSELRHRIRAQRPAAGRGGRGLGGTGRAARRGAPPGPQRPAAAAGPAAGSLSAPLLPRPDRAGDRGVHGDPGGQPLSWAADGRILAFQFWTQPGGITQVRLLDTTSPGGSLRATRAAVTFVGHGQAKTRPDR